MDGVLFKLAPDRYWYVQADGALETWLLAHSEGYDIAISDPQSRVIQIQGPASLDIMRAASAGRIDDMMVRMDAVFPGYGFSQHKGYGTRQHLRSIERMGPCQQHRRSFSPMRQRRHD